MDSRKSTSGPIFLLSLGATFLYLVMVDNQMSALGLGLFTFTFLLYVNRLGKTIPIMEFMLLMATSQWILGAYFAYVLDLDHFRYYMYVEEEEYMSIVVPGTAAFIGGVLIFYPRLNITKLIGRIKYLANHQPKIAYILLVLGFGLPLLNPFIPAVLSFVVYLLSNLKYIGIALLLFRENSKQKWQILIAVMVFALIGSLATGMFHDLLLWGAIMFSFVALEIGLRFWPKLLLIFGGLLFVLVLQSIKGQYREMIMLSEYESGSKLELFYELMSEKASDLDLLFSEEILGQLNVRLNQGWIISAIIDNIPELQPFANGETIEEAFYASLVPRFLDPNKKRAGGQENFERFTGLEINEGSTSMGTSIIGEAYGNYGIGGSWFFMFVWGAFISVVFRFIVNYGRKNILIYFFLPIIFLQVIKAETELYVVLNHFLKSLILVFGLLWFFKKYLGWKYEVEEMGEERHENSGNPLPDSSIALLSQNDGAN